MLPNCFLCIVNTDYIIVGQGIAGTMLSYKLMQAGKRVLVIDENDPASASKVASGVVNPVTGRRVVSTWMIDELLPYTRDAYTEIGELLGVSCISRKDILAFHATEQMQRAFLEKMDENGEYVSIVANEENYKQWFDFYHGIGVIEPAYLIDLETLLTHWRKHLQAHNSLLEERFECLGYRIENGLVYYKDIVAEKVIMCDGAAGINDPYFKRLAYGLTKGEALIVEIPDLPPTNIYKQGYSIVPWKDGLFWIGSTFAREYDDLQPTQAFRESVEQQLNSWLKLPYKIVDHIASQRAGTIERRPFVGLHPEHNEVGIFNGMGTKGCSLAPYFANEFTRHLLYGEPINELADVRRFEKILTR